MPGYDTLHALALDQHGVVTAEQGKAIGVTAMAMVMMARRGRLTRLATGVYQDNGAPVTRWTHYMAAALWPNGVRAVLSHATALSLMDLSDVNPAVIHLTVPARYRTHRALPPGTVLHYANLEPGEITAVEGVPVTTAARAIRDCAAAGIGPALLRQALDDGRKTGWLQGGEADALQAQLVAAGQL